MKGNYKNYISLSEYKKVDNSISLQGFSFENNETVIFFGNAGADSQGLSIVNNENILYYIPNNTSDLIEIIEQIESSVDLIDALSLTVPVLGAPLNPTVSVQAQKILLELSELKNRLK